ncbi:MAG: metallophosphoesterase [Planctomycetaceae bacterium]
MSLHVLPLSRRGFLSSISGGIAVLNSTRSVGADDSVDPNKWAFLSDTHIAGDETTQAHGATMFENLNRVIDEVLAERPKPTGVLINGDCAYLKGLSQDYQTLAKAIARFTEAGLPVHFNMGNHDDRGPFYKAFAGHRPKNTPVKGKHVTIITGPKANLFMVDSLRVVDHVTGELGKPQIKWLLAALKAHGGKPAVIVGHHNTQYMPKDSKETVTGLKDTPEFIEALHSASNAHAYVFGHTHDWKLKKTSGGLHLVNLPPTSYVFNETRPNGWVRVKLDEKRLHLELRALDKKHSQHGSKHVLEHRYAR